MAIYLPIMMAMPPDGLQSLLDWSDEYEVPGQPAHHWLWPVVL